VSQRLIPTVEPSSLLTHTATTGRGLSFGQMKGWQRFLNFNEYALHNGQTAPAHFKTMNELTKLIASISAVIASLSFAWIALTITGTIPHRHITVFHDGSVAIIQIAHPGSAGDTD
jgi:hypothetical protein